MPVVYWDSRLQWNHVVQYGQALPETPHIYCWYGFEVIFVWVFWNFNCGQALLPQPHSVMWPCTHNCVLLSSTGFFYVLCQHHNVCSAFISVDQQYNIKLCSLILQVLIGLFTVLHLNCSFSYFCKEGHWILIGIVWICSLLFMI